MKTLIRISRNPGVCITLIVGVLIATLLVLHIWEDNHPKPKLAKTDKPVVKAARPKATPVEVISTNEPATDAAPPSGDVAIRMKATPPPDFGKMAYYTGVEACRRCLKAPSSAKFSNPYSNSDTGWNSYGYYQWKVGGTVDAQNSFGTMLRQKWFAVVQYNIGQFEVVYFNLDGETVGTMPDIRRAPGY